MEHYIELVAIVANFALTLQAQNKFHLHGFENRGEKPPEIQVLF